MFGCFGCAFAFLVPRLLGGRKFGICFARFRSVSLLALRFARFVFLLTALVCCLMWREFACLFALFVCGFAMV